MNSGPGNASGIFVHEKHHNADLPRFAGWWGHNKERRFKMEPKFDAVEGADGWQISNLPVLSLAPYLASVDMIDEIGMDAIIEKRNKLKDMQFSIKDKHNRESKMITFYEENDECPTCEQLISFNFKEKKIKQNQTSVKLLDEGLLKLTDEMSKVDVKLIGFKAIAKQIRDNEVLIAQTNTSILELEKFNVKLQTEINGYKTDSKEENDTDKLKDLKEQLENVSKQKTKLKEDKIYYEAARSMLMDTGIKTKIIKQYLPIMNKLINKYLTSMEFYVNFTLDENFEETIKSRYRDEFSYASFSEGEKMRIDLALLFTWRAIAKMKNSTNTNLLMLDEIFDSSLDAATSQSSRASRRRSRGEGDEESKGGQWR